MSTVISVEHLSKTYRLGQVSTSSTQRIGTGRFRQAQSDAFSRDLEVWWATRVRGKTLMTDFDWTGDEF